MSGPVIEYEPRLVEEAVFYAVRARREETAFRAERDRLYEIADPEEREAGFRAFHAAWFTRLGLGEGLDDAFREQPSVAANVVRYLVASASAGREEGAELFVSPESRREAAHGRALLICLKPETFTLSGRLRPLLRHELLHIADMLDPDFGYEPRLPLSGADPSYQRLLKDRYGVLWDAYIDGRLARLGWALPDARAARLSEFQRAFPMLGALAEACFDRFFGAASLRHAELLAFAFAPESDRLPSGGLDRVGDEDAPRAA
jgi:hypothetical protein